jgi:hypothetical protein
MTALSSSSRVRGAPLNPGTHSRTPDLSFRGSAHPAPARPQQPVRDRGICFPFPGGPPRRPGPALSGCFATARIARAAASGLPWADDGRSLGPATCGASVRVQRGQASERQPCFEPRGCAERSWTRRRLACGHRVPVSGRERPESTLPRVRFRTGAGGGGVADYKRCGDASASTCISSVFVPDVSFRFHTRVVAPVHWRDPHRWHILTDGGPQRAVQGLGRRGVRRATDTRPSSAARVLSPHARGHGGSTALS